MYSFGDRHHQGGPLCKSDEVKETDKWQRWFTLQPKWKLFTTKI